MQEGVQKETSDGLEMQDRAGVSSYPYWKVCKMIDNYAEWDVEYVKAVKKCKTLFELNMIVTKYKLVAEDAYSIVQSMTYGEFEQFCKQRNRSRPSMKWMKEYGPVLLPKDILEIGLVATTFNVPFGVAYNRMRPS